LGNKDYNGGLFPVWITLKEPVADANSISWRIGKTSRIAYRTQARNAQNFITADTAFLYWEKAPMPHIDSVQVKRDTVKIWKRDTTYLDTVFAIIDDRLQSMPLVIEVKNILPHIKNISVSGVEQPGDSLLTIAALSGNPIVISIRLEKTFNKNGTILDMPPEMGNLIPRTQTDTLHVYEWTAPNYPIADSSIYLRIRDTGGYGERLYRVYLVVYTESSSIWVATEDELVKYSPAGARVANISGVFNSISDIAVNSNNGQLFVIDQFKNSLIIYDTYGKELYQNDVLFEEPTSVAVSVEDASIWVADAVGLHRCVFNGAELSIVMSYPMSGPIKGLSVNQYGGNFGGNFVWFTIPQSDTVGLIRNPNVQKPEFILDNWNRPSMVSHDPASGIAWVADSTRIVAIDANGKILARIKNFGFVSSVSASGGDVWASDIFSGKVYRFKGPFNTSTLQPLELTAITRGIPASDIFYTPISVSAFTADGGAWVVDRDYGMVVRLDSLGNPIASGTGLKLPKLGLTIQKRE